MPPRIEGHTQGESEPTTRIHNLNLRQQGAIRTITDWASLGFSHHRSRMHRARTALQLMGHPAGQQSFGSWLIRNPSSKVCTYFINVFYNTHLPSASSFVLFSVAHRWTGGSFFSQTVQLCGRRTFPQWLVVKLHRRYVQCLAKGSSFSACGMYRLLFIYLMYICIISARTFQLIV